VPQPGPLRETALDADNHGGEQRMTSDIPMGRLGSALVVLDDERAVLAATLVLQEMGLTVDVANDREAALDWIVRAHYALVVEHNERAAATAHGDV
jgi:hypothetical protein